MSWSGIVWPLILGAAASAAVLIAAPAVLRRTSSEHRSVGIWVFAIVVGLAVFFLSFGMCN